MKVEISREELERRLEERVVCQVFDEMYQIFARWNKGGALIHRVRAMGYLAESGARNIRDGQTPITTETTFEQMKEKDRKTYDKTLDFILSFVASGIYKT